MSFSKLSHHENRPAAELKELLENARKLAHAQSNEIERLQDKVSSLIQDKAKEKVALQQEVRKWQAKCEEIARKSRHEPYQWL